MIFKLVVNLNSLVKLALKRVQIVCVQIWIAVCVYLLIAVVKKKLNMEQSLYTILQTLNLCLFEKTPINQLFEKQICKFKEQDDYN